MENTNTHFECEIENLWYTTIEEKTANYFNMGLPDNSSIPPEMKANDSNECTLICTRKSGDFYISNYKLRNGKYLLSVSLNGKLHNV